MEQPDYARHYSHWHNESPEHLEKMSSFYQKTVTPHLQNNKEIEILDIGCGVGFLLIGLQKAGYSNTKGIEVDKRQAESCKRKGLDVELVASSIDYLAKKGNTFDVITAFDVLEHIPPNEQIAFINAIHWALKPEGVLLLTVPNANSILASRNRYIDYTHHVLFTEVSLDFVIYNGGFKQITILPMDYVTFKCSFPSIVHFILLKTVRFFRRILMIIELGSKQGRQVPLTFNLLGKAIKKL